MKIIGRLTDSRLFLHSLYTMNFRYNLLQISCFFCMLAAFSPAAGQNSVNTPASIRQASWQQKVNHQMNISLDDERKMLRGVQVIEYFNNSPQALNEIWLHVWPNAFESRQTAYGREAVLKGNQRFFNLSEEDRGFIDSMQFEIDGVNVSFTYHPEHRDIIRLQLPAALASGAMIKIRSAFRVKIPFLFSRMGVDDGLFSITQWYPKPAVFDVNGWNIFPYLEQGEYFSEFGDYDVTLDVPAEMRVGATGVLQDSSEMDWLEELAEEPELVDKRTGRKKIRFVQSNVCDFAWFASDKFKVYHDECLLKTGKKVKTHAFYKPDKYEVSGKTITDAIARALQYYSNRVGTYPYEHCSAVVGPLKAAGGMEYPMITICASASEEVIVHEVGHNWFQGIIANNERRYPWMDESINSFYENQCLGNGSEAVSPGDALTASSTYSGQMLNAAFGLYQEGNLHSSLYTDKNYGSVIYGINTRRILYLQEYLGTKTFDTCMKTYFNRWKFRHPLPGDMQQTFEEVSKKQLSWFFNGLMGAELPDYKIKYVKKSGTELEVKIRNKGTYNLPVKLQWIYQHGKQKDHVWVFGDTTIRINGKAWQLALNPTGVLPESDLNNNDARTQGAFKTWKKLKFGLPNITKRGENRIWALPWLFAWNKNDGWMPGLILSNIQFPRKRWEWWLNPMYGIKSEDVTGFAGLRRNIFHKKGPFSLTEVTSAYRRFSFLSGSSDPAVSAYNRFSLQYSTWLKRKKPWVSNNISAEVLVLRMDRTAFKAPEYRGDSIVGEVLNTGGRRWESDLLKFSWVRESNKKFLPSRSRLFLTYGGNKGTLTGENKVLPGDFMMASGDWSAYFRYPGVKKAAGLRVKGYFSAMLMNNYPSANSGLFVIPISAPQSTPNDFSFSQLSYMRSANFGSGNGIWSNYLLADANGIRMFPNLNTKTGVAGISASTTIIPGLPIELFADAVWTPDQNLSENVLYAAGLSYNQHIGNTTVFEVNLPLFYSNTFKDFMEINPRLRFYNMVSFRVSIDMNSPFTFARNILNIL